MADQAAGSFCDRLARTENKWLGAGAHRLREIIAKADHLAQFALGVVSRLAPFFSLNSTTHASFVIVIFSAVAKFCDISMSAKVAKAP